MKVEDLLPIVKRELAKVGMVEHVAAGYFTNFFDVFYEETRGTSRFKYQNLRLVSFEKVDRKWHVTAKFENALEPDTSTTVNMVIDDETGEVSEMSSG